MRVLTGSYSGQASSKTINLGARPALVIVKTENQKSLFWHEFNWCGFPQHLDQDASSWSVPPQLREIYATDAGFVVLGGNAKVNAAGATHYFTAFFRDDSSLWTGSWMGNNKLSRTIDFGWGEKPAILVEKRDGSGRMAIAYTKFSGTGQSKRFDAAAEADYINNMNSDGSFVTTPTTGNLPLVNDLDYSYGEAMDSFAFFDGADVYSTQYTGNGTAQSINLPFSASHVFIVPRTATSITLWNNKLPAGKSFDGQATAFYADRVTGGGSSISLGSSTSVNGSASTYFLIAVRNNPTGVLYSESLASPYTTKAHKLNTTDTPSYQYINCSNSDATLKITGAISLEWWGCPHWSRAGTSGGEANLMVRQSGGTATPAQSSWSWGLSANMDTTRGFCGLDVITSNFFDRIEVTNIFDIAAGTNNVGDIRTKWRTGFDMRNHVPVHIIVTFDGTSLWKLFVNGRLVKVRDINLADGNLRFGGASIATAASPVLTNIASNSGDRTSFNTRYAAGSATQAAANRFDIYQASVYALALSAAQVQARYKLSVLNDLTQVDITPAERWLFSENSGATTVAVINSANNGVSYNTGTPSFNGKATKVFNVHPV